MSTEMIPLAAGEGAVIEFPGPVSLRLVNGAVEICGRTLPTDEPLVLRSARRGVVLYSLEGGTVAATPAIASATAGGSNMSSNATVHVARTASQVPCLLPIARSLAKLPPGSTIAVVGHIRGAGKSLAARTLVNLLFRDAVTGRRGGFESVTLIGGDANTNDSVAPGCLSAVRVSRPGINFGAPHFDEAHVSFFSKADGPVSEASTQALHWLSQAVDSTRGALGSSTTLTVVDTEAPPSSGAAAAENYFFNIVDICNPAAVVFVGGEKDSAEFATVQRTLERNAGGGGGGGGAAPMLVHVPTLHEVTTTKTGGGMNNATQQQQQHDREQIRHQHINDRVEEYFCGTPAFPLKCAKIVVPLSKVSLLQLTRGGDAQQQHQQQQQHMHPVRIANAGKELVGRICGVSLAAVESEVAFANVAGVVLIDSINPAVDELVLFAPAGGDGPDDTCLVRPFLLVGDSRLVYRGGSAVAAASV